MYGVYSAYPGTKSVLLHSELDGVWQLVYKLEPMLATATLTTVTQQFDE